MTAATLAPTSNPADAFSAAGRYGCSGCTHLWSGVSRCHCSGRLTATVTFMDVDAKKGKVLAKRFPKLASVRGDGQHGAEMISRLSEDTSASMPKIPRGGYPMPGGTQERELTESSWTKVEWGVIGNPGTQIVEFLADGDQILGLRAMDDDGNTRVLYLRSVIPRTRGEAVAAPVEEITVVIRNGCHRTFAGEGGFLLHRAGGEGCQHPATIFRGEGDTKVRALYLNDGIWGSEEHPADRGAALRAYRERQLAEAAEAESA